MNQNSGISSSDLAQSLSSRFNASVTSFDRTAQRIAQTLRQSVLDSSGKRSTGR
ncbi:hypothetical protein ACXR0M_19395 [Pseudomonas sp. Eth.TT006]